MPNGSRFWTFTPVFILIAAGLSVHFEDASVFTNPFMLWLGGAAAKTSIESHHKGRNAP